MKRVVGLIVVLTLAVPATATACPKTSVTDIEDEVMCPVCGTSLATSGDAPLAVQQRKLIADMVAQCKSKDEIKDALVEQYGEVVLAEPKQEGFGLATYAVPGVALLAGLAGVVFAAARWRRRRGTAAVEQPEPEADERLERDLARYDL